MNKFRVWDGMRMWYPLEESKDGDTRGYLLSMDGGVWVLSPDGMAKAPDVIPLFAVGRQFKDVDGNERELYDGDMVRYLGSSKLCMVYWDKSNAHFAMQRDDGYAFSLSDFDRDFWTVIGNRYENPELL